MASDCQVAEYTVFNVNPEHFQVAEYTVFNVNPEHFQVAEYTVFNVNPEHFQCFNSRSCLFSMGENIVYGLF